MEQLTHTRLEGGGKRKQLMAKLKKTRDDGVQGDGGDQKVDDKLLEWLKDEVYEIVAGGESGLWDSRTDSWNTRLCIWAGQSSDGRKHADENNDEPVMPFEGAVDGRHRITDMLINEDMMLVVLASMRARISMVGVGENDVAAVSRMETVFRWVRDTQLGYRYMRELIKLAQYTFGDSPAVGVMGVTWRQETQLEMKTLTAQELMDLYLQVVMDGFARGAEDVSQEDLEQEASAAAEQFLEVLADDAYGEDALIEILQNFFPYVKTKRARKVIKGLREEGAARFPAPYLKYNGLELNAKRLYEDCFIPSSTIEFQRTRVYFEPDWLTRTEVLQRQIEFGWSDTFVEDLIGKDDERGQAGVVTFSQKVRDKNGQLVDQNMDASREMYQVVTAYWKDVNEDGVVGIYYVTFHADIEVAATDARVLDYAHGNYPCHAFQREVLDSRLMDSRGIAELAGSHQDLLKMYSDSFGDNAQLTAVPPMVTRGRKNQGALYIEPLAELQAKREGDFQWLSPPQYPNQVDEMMKEIRRQIDEYHGRPGDEVAGDLVNMHREFKVMWWLANLKEVHMQMLQLIQQYIPEETLIRITDDEGNPVARSRDEIQGQYDIRLTFDPRDFDPEYLKLVGETIMNVLMPMDREKTIDPSPVIANLFWRLQPELAQSSIRNVEKARDTEIDDERKAYQTILGGEEPELADDGSINYQLRIQHYQAIQQQNPKIFEGLAQDRTAILQSRLERLQMLAEQYGENADIGRQGGREALPLEAE